MQATPGRAPALAAVPVAPDRPDKIRDILQVYRLVQAIPALPLPTTSPARATFDYRYLTSGSAARMAVTSARTALSRAFGVTFTERPETAGDDTPRYLLEALLPSGLTLVIVSRVQIGGDMDPGDREDTGRRVLAAVAA